MACLFSFIGMMDMTSLLPPFLLLSSNVSLQPRSRPLDNVVCRSREQWSKGSGRRQLPFLPPCHGQSLENWSPEKWENFCPKITPSLKMDPAASLSLQETYRLHPEMWASTKWERCGTATGKLPWNTWACSLSCWQGKTELFGEYSALDNGHFSFSEETWTVEWTPMGQ